MSAPAAAAAQEISDSETASTAAAAAPSRDSCMSLLVADAVEDTVVVIRDEQRSILHHQHVHRPAPHGWIGLLVDQETREKRFGLDHLSFAVQCHPKDVVALFCGAVPGAVPSDENIVFVFGRERLTGVEAHPERSNVRAEFQHRWCELRARPTLAVLGVERVALMAIWKPEMLALVFHHAEFVLRQVIADPVAGVVGKPQFF